MVVHRNTLHYSGSVRPDYVPASDYISRDVDRLEREKLWPKTWQIACREEEIPQPGNYVNYEIGEESILIVRTDTYEIKSFYNVCSHRGRRLKEGYRGTVRSLNCNYHAWSFDLDGNVINIPGEDDWRACPEFNRDGLGLSQIRTGTWAGFVWVCMDDEAESLDAYLGELREALDPFEFEACRLRLYKTIVMPVNWKVVLEAFVEGYHTRGTHPQFGKFGLPVYPPTWLKDPLARHAGHGIHVDPNAPKQARFADPRLLVQTMIEELYETLGAMYHDEGLQAARRLINELPAGTPEKEVYDAFFRMQREEVLKAGAQWPAKLTPEHLSTTQWLIFPNSSVLPTAEGALWYRVRPNGAQERSCIFDIWSLARVPQGSTMSAGREFYPDLDSFKGTMPFLEQDFTNLIAVDQGMRSRGWKGSRPNPQQESNVWHLHKVLHRYIYAADPE